MGSRLLEEQQVYRRRAVSHRGTARRTVVSLARQARRRSSDSLRERAGVAARVTVLVVAIAGLATGLVMVGNDARADEILAETVAPADAELATIASPELSGVMTEAEEPAPAGDEDQDQAQDQEVPPHGAPSTGVLFDTSDLPPVEFARTEDYEYVVGEGETLSEIAAEFDLTFDVLAEYNSLADPNTLSPGQRIFIPSEDFLPGSGL